jgi:putative phosphoesterase
MNIIALSDIHGSLEYLPAIGKQLKKADLVMIAGDITHFGQWAQAEEIISQIRAYNQHVLAVPGNCDKFGVDEYLASERINLSRKCVEIGGITFCGLGGSLPCPGKTPNEFGEQVFTESLEELSPKENFAGNLVLMTHQPAVGTAVDSIAGMHSGSAAVRDFIEKNKPVLAISGHIHEAIGTDNIGPTTLINPGPFSRGNFGCIELDGDNVKTSIHQLAVS